MARVSLIVPMTARAWCPSERIESARQALNDAGYEVEMLVIVDLTCPSSGLEFPGSIRIPTYGLARCGQAGLIVAQGEFSIIVEPTFDYAPSDLVALANRMADSPDLDLVTASRRRTDGTGKLGRATGSAAEMLAGTTDPLTGLYAIRQGSIQEHFESLHSSGDHLLWELLAYVERSRRAELSVSAPRRGWSRVGFHEVRHLKSLADRRYGNLSRLLQFCIVGASGMMVDLTVYALLKIPLEGGPLSTRAVPFIGGTLDLGLAGAISIWLALTWNFLLNRRMTFSYARDGSILRQYFTYAMSNSPGIALSWTIRLFLPPRVPFFESHKLAAAVVGIVAATGISFTMARWLVFQKPDGSNLETTESPKFAEAKIR